MNLSRFFQSFVPMFRPPFPGLWLAALLYYAWSFLVYPGSPTLRGDLPDPDDYMYLTQVMDWLKGQGWYDNVQHRLDPPAGVPIHFSRLAQIPMAGFILLFQALGLPMKGAAQITAFIEPLILFATFFAAIRWLAQSFMPKEWAGVTAFVTLFAMGKMLSFTPGHIDHHGLNIILIIMSLSCLMRLMEKPEQCRWALYAGGLIALSFTIALEVLPWLLLISAWLGLWAVVRGGTAARSALLYALALYLGSVLGLVLNRAPQNLFVFDVLAYSVVYVFLTAGIAVCFAGIALAADVKPWVRWFIAAVLAVICGGWFLEMFPTLSAGPYGSIDPALAQIILGEMSEAKSLLNAGKQPTMFIMHASGIVVALIVSAFLVKREGAQNGWRFGLIALLLSAAFLLSVFYQSRFLGMGEALSIIPLSMLLQQGWGWIAANLNGRKKVFAEIALLLLVGPLPSVLFPALFDGRSFNQGVILFPATGLGSLCETSRLEKILRDPRFFGNRPRLILTGIGLGPEILFRTQHSVLSAPYHMDVQGNLDATRFFSTPYPAEAEDIAHRRQVDLIVACRLVPDMYVVESLSSPEGRVRDKLPHFVEYLMSGRVPPWLHRVAFKDLDNFLIYEVVPEKFTEKFSGAQP